MSEGICELDGNVIDTNIDYPTYGNEEDDKPKQDGAIGHQYFTERDNLQTNYNNLTKERDQLQFSYKNMTEERNQLQSERDKLQRERYELQSERDKLPSERDKLKSERDKLQSERDSFLHVFGKSNYYVSMERNNWEYANQDCLKRGAKLVIINNQKEQKFLISLNIHTWIGLTDSEAEGTWRWVDGTPLTTAYWGEKEPNSGGDKNKDEDCAGINNFWYSDPVKKWNDFTCNTQLNWICEKVNY
ncbi:hepatic lectin-like isoform X2 [Esox lucius]|uniref:C-type lectin domain-containing protein n=1 Tax=Esox lucius TaxID=8010 RepID=A0A6Q2X5Z8_ESOLU|nr:hepatic lectin-like isoform X2 [Esox lucius]